MGVYKDIRKRVGVWAVGFGNFGLGLWGCRVKRLGLGRLGLSRLPIMRVKRLRRCPKSLLGFRVLGLGLLDFLRI